MKPDRFPDPNDLRFVTSDHSPNMLYIADGEEVVGSFVDNMPALLPRYVIVSMYEEMYTVEVPPPEDEFALTGDGMVGSRWHIGHAIVEAIAQRYPDIGEPQHAGPTEYWFIRTFSDLGAKSLTYTDTRMFEDREEAVAWWDNDDARQFLMRAQRGDACVAEDVAHIPTENLHKVFVVNLWLSGRSWTELAQTT